MRGTLNAMQQIASQIQDQNTTLADIARQGEKDSRALKTLSVIATAYLPATLIAVREQ
jgi:Mg2+ and Co2+ transporter CorA